MVGVKLFIREILPCLAKIGYGTKPTNYRRLSSLKAETRCEFNDFSMNK